MKKADSRKLALARETLVALSPEVLAEIAGGQGTITSLTTQVTRLICPSLAYPCKPTI